ncbi:MAG: helix-turn-helix domain-containing protein [Rhodobacteraceae bacterium]|nr:helix-turn-helix domain-containing protein [Paracoccaceae bacterium]
MDLGDRLNSLRRKSGQSLQSVADEVGVSKAHIWELEKGRSSNPSFELMNKLASHFGVGVGVLTGETEEPAVEDLQIERIHRDLKMLTDRDRQIIEEMVRSMARQPGEGT